MSPPADPSAGTLLFRKRHRLTHAREFDVVYAAKIRKTRGPLTLFAAPNALAWPRLGLAVSARIGGAVVRNRWKRMVREAFRRGQHSLARGPAGECYDLIVSVRAAPGQPVWTLQACTKTLAELAADADRELRRRARREPEGAAGQE